ncbi:hypothetical protein L7F22_060840 [Adiantum nelumboides]|nr:hypothetical protein [Adiantum nelumboides]
MSKNDGISGLVNDKLDKNNFHAWKFRITNFLMGKGYWDYIDGNQEEMPELPDVDPTAEQIKAFKDWNQGARKIKNELNTVKKENLSINDYTLKIKGIVESPVSIGVQSLKLVCDVSPYDWRFEFNVGKSSSKLWLQVFEQDVQAHFMEFKALIRVLEKSYDVILKRKEKASYAYLVSCLEDASYDNYDSSFSVDGDASSLCDHDTNDVCSSVSSLPCVEGRGNVCIWDFDHMDGPVESICGRPMVDMDSMPVFDVYDDDEGVASIGDMIMSDMPIWDVESSQEENPYVDMDAFMAMNAAKAEEEICVMESEREEVESSMWEAMDASNASTHVSQDLKEVADVDDWLSGASPMCVWLPMDGPIVVDTDSSCDDASSYDMVDDMHAIILDDVFLPPSDALSRYPDDLWVACSQSDDYGICVVDDSDCDWGFDDPQVEMNDEMKMNVIKAMTRIDAMRDAKKNGRDGSAFDASNDVPMDGLESLFDKYEVDFGPVYDVDHAFEHMVDGYRPFLFDPGGRRAFYLLVNWATVLWPFDPGGC